MNQTHPLQDKNIKFNKNAKEYIPKHKKQQTKVNNKEKVNFNFQAKEDLPKVNDFQIGDLEDDDDEAEDTTKYYDDIMKDLLKYDHIDDLQNGLDEESDEDKWYPEYRNCLCCKGLAYKCSGEVCKSLGVCYCKAKEDYDDEK